MVLLAQARLLKALLIPRPLCHGFLLRLFILRPTIQNLLIKCTAIQQVSRFGGLPASNSNFLAFSEGNIALCRFYLFLRSILCKLLALDMGFPHVVKFRNWIFKQTVHSFLHRKFPMSILSVTMFHEPVVMMVMMIIQT